MGRWIIIIITSNFEVYTFDMYGTEQAAQAATKQLASRYDTAHSAQYINISDAVQVNVLNGASIALDGPVSSSVPQE